MLNTKLKCTSLILLVGVALAVTSAGSADQSSTEAVKEQLLGSWSGAAPDGTPVGFVFRADGSVSFVVAGDPTEQLFRVDAAARPMELDIYEHFFLNGEAVDVMYMIKAVFVLDGDSLTMAFRMGTESVRPTKMDEGQVMTLTRDR